VFNDAHKAHAFGCCGSVDPAAAAERQADERRHDDLE
jgi:hypothetical protein